MAPAQKVSGMLRFNSKLEAKSPIKGLFQLPPMNNFGIDLTLVPGKNFYLNKSLVRYSPLLLCLPLKRARGQVVTADWWRIRLEVKTGVDGLKKVFYHHPSGDQVQLECLKTDKQGNYCLVLDDLNVEIYIPKHPSSGQTDRKKDDITVEDVFKSIRRDNNKVNVNGLTSAFCGPNAQLSLNEVRLKLRLMNTAGEYGWTPLDAFKEVISGVIRNGDECVDPQGIFLDPNDPAKVIMVLNKAVVNPNAGKFQAQLVVAAKVNNNESEWKPVQIPGFSPVEMESPRLRNPYNLDLRLPENLALEQVYKGQQGLCWAVQIATDDIDDWKWTKPFPLSESFFRFGHQQQQQQQQQQHQPNHNPLKRQRQAEQPEDPVQRPENPVQSPGSDYQDLLEVFEGFQGPNTPINGSLNPNTPMNPNTPTPSYGSLSPRSSSMVSSPGESTQDADLDQILADPDFLNTVDLMPFGLGEMNQPLMLSAVTKGADDEDDDNDEGDDELEVDKGQQMRSEDLAPDEKSAVGLITWLFVGFMGVLLGYFIHKFIG